MRASLEKFKEGGRIAYKEGKLSISCPIAKGDPARDAWLEGYQEAKYKDEYGEQEGK